MELNRVDGYLNGSSYSTSASERHHTPTGVSGVIPRSHSLQWTQCEVHTAGAEEPVGSSGGGIMDQREGVRSALVGQDDEPTIRPTGHTREVERAGGIESVPASG